MKRTRGSILIGLLWCLAILAVVVVGVLHTARMDLLVVKNYSDRLQAHYLALAGIERAKALLYQDYVTRRRTSKSHTGTLYDDARDFENVSFGRGRFSVFHRARADEGGGIVYGITDEESRLNVNMASPDQLTNIDGLTPDIAASIVAWRSDPSAGAAGGAEADYYSGLKPPYVPRNAPFQTVRELLMVRGVTPGALLGEASQSQNDFPGGAGDDAFSIDGGWSDLMTVNSTGKDFSAAGKQRVDIQNAGQTDLTGIQGITPDIAQAIISYRGQKQFKSIADLLDVTAPTNRFSSGDESPSKTMIDDQLFMQIADDVTIGDGADLAGLVNINTAGPDVLACLPPIDRALAQSIISYRKSNGYFNNIGELLKVSGMTHDIFKQIASHITARSETFRINCEGRITSSGTRQRIQAIVHIGAHEATTLYYREDM